VEKFETLKRLNIIVTQYIVCVSEGIKNSIAASNDLGMNDAVLCKII
jgi:hypothetical protein